MTEAQLADSKYNWLRNDVIKAMNDGGKVVMVGMAATALAPYLIEYAAVYGEEALLNLVENVGEQIVKDKVSEASRDFALGCLEEFMTQTMFWMIEHPNEWGDVPSKYWHPLFSRSSNETAEFWESIVKGGVKRAISGLKYDDVSSVLTCLSEFEITRYYKMIHSKAETKEILKKVLVDVLECGASLIAKQFTDKMDKELKDKVENTAIEIGIDNFNQWWTDCLSKVMDVYENRFIQY